MYNNISLCIISAFIDDRSLSPLTARMDGMEDRSTSAQRLFLREILLYYICQSKIYL